MNEEKLAVKCCALVTRAIYLSGHCCRLHSRIFRVIPAGSTPASFVAPYDVYSDGGSANNPWSFDSVEMTELRRVW